MSRVQLPRQGGASSHCPSCGGDIQDGDSFCPACGRKLTALADVQHLAEPAEPAAEADPSLKVADLVCDLVELPEVTVSVSESRALLARALLAEGRSAEAERVVADWLQDDGFAEPTIEQSAIRAVARTGQGDASGALTDAWTVVAAQRGRRRLTAVAARAAALRDGPAPELLHRVADGQNGRDRDRDVAHFVLAVAAGDLQQAAQAARWGRPWLHADELGGPTRLDDTDPELVLVLPVLVDAWRIRYGTAVTDAVLALLESTAGARLAQSGTPRSAAELASASDAVAAAAPVLSQPLLRLSAAAHDRTGERAAAADIWMRVAREEDLEARLAVAQADLADVLALDPDRSEAWYIASEYHRYQAQIESPPDPDEGLLRTAMHEWNRAAALRLPAMKDAWAYTTLATLSDLKESWWRRNSWETALAYACSLLLDPEMHRTWVYLARQLRGAGEYLLGVTVLAIATEDGEPDAAAAAEAALERCLVETLYTDGPDDELLSRVGNASMEGLLRGVRLLRQQLPQDAVAVLDKAFKTAQDSDDDARSNALFLGCAQAAAGDPASARDTLLPLLPQLTASWRKGSRGWVDTSLGIVMALVGDPAQAVETARRQLENLGLLTLDDDEIRALAVLAAAADDDVDGATMLLVDFRAAQPPPAVLAELRSQLRALRTLRPTTAATVDALLPETSAATGRQMPTPDVAAALRRALEVAREAADAPLASAGARAVRAVLLRREGDSVAALAELDLLLTRPAPEWAAHAARMARDGLRLDAAVAELAAGHALPDTNELTRLASRLAPDGAGAFLAARLAALPDVEDVWRARAALQAAAVGGDAVAVSSRDQLLDTVLERVGARMAGAVDVGEPRVVVELGSWLVPPDSVANWERWSLFTEVIPQVRDQVEQETGVRPPGVRVRPGAVGPTDIRVVVDDALATGRRVGLEGVTAPLSPIGPPAPVGEEVTGPSETDRAALSLIGDVLQQELRRRFGRLVGVDDVAALLQSWAEAPEASPADVPTLTTEAAASPDLLARATALVGALLDQRVPVRRNTVIPALLADEGGERDQPGALFRAVERVRAASLPELVKRAAGRSRVTAPVEWEDSARLTDHGWVIDPVVTERFVTELTAPASDRSDVVVTVTSCLLRSAAETLLRPRFPDIEMFVADELTETGR